MKKFEVKLTEEAVLLNSYLSQYRRCIERKKFLEKRRNDIIREFDNPLKGMSCDGMPHGSSEGTGCAALSFRLDEINTKIREQIDKATKILTEIMDVIEFLPENSVEREIIEHRYLDGYNWGKTCRAENISRTPATKYWRKGLYKLLEFEKVKKILKEYAQASGEENF